MNRTFPLFRVVRAAARTGLTGLGFEKRFLLIVTSLVILAIGVLTALIVRRETAILRAEHLRDARMLAEAVNISLRESMLSGRVDDTRRLLDKLSQMRGISGLSVLKGDLTAAFGRPVGDLDVDASVRERLAAGEDITVAGRGRQYFFRPLMNETACWRCHPREDPLRAVVVMTLPSAEVEHNAWAVVLRMAGFAVVAAAGLAIVLAAVSRRMVLTPVKGLTAAARQIADGNFVLFRPRGTHCHESRRCGQSSCPAYKNREIPCWLQSGTLCPEEGAAAEGDKCLSCEVYRGLHGDEIVQLMDTFNNMSLTLRRHEEELLQQTHKILGLNRQLTASNDRLGTLLEASRMTTSTLALDGTLPSALGIILRVTNMKSGIIFLIEDESMKRCRDFFDCTAYTCPAYRTDAPCWTLPGTMCDPDGHRDSHRLLPKRYRDEPLHTCGVSATTMDEKIEACGNCNYFMNVLLVRKMASGVGVGDCMGERLRIDNMLTHRALLKGGAVVDHAGGNPFGLEFTTRTEIAVPLKTGDRTGGMLYLASDEVRHHEPEEIEFFQLLAEIISAGIFNSTLYGELETSYLQTVTSLANAVEAKDPYTRGHSERVADLCRRIAEAACLSAREREHLRFASILHDIGKIGISVDLIRKESCLAPDEILMMQSHPERGVQILDPVRFLRPLLPAILHHHERFDGAGYPFGLRGKAIPFQARILCVADAWDAMRSDRPYRKALSVDSAIAELRRHAGTQFDPEVVELFLVSVEGARA